MMTAASTSASPASARSSQYPEDTLETCEELQQDELLALEAIYEGRVRHRRQSDGELACFIDVDIDLQSAREVIIIEQAVSPCPAPKAQPKAQPIPSRHANRSSADGPVTARHGRGRGGRGRGEQGDRFPHSSPAGPFPAGPTARADGDLQEALEGLALARPVAKEEAPPPVETVHELRLQYLPPLLMSVTLPPAYPTEQPPVIALDAAWLSDTLRHILLQRMEPLWQSDPCIYLLIDEVQAFFGDLDSSLSASTRLTLFDRYITTIPSACAPEPPRTPLSSILASHDHAVRHSTFSSESFDCGICLETKKGIRCTRLNSCGHVFCVECLYSFFELNIREGMVKNVSCADAECVKSKSKEGGSHTAGMVSEEEIEAIVGKDLADRYRWLVKKQKIESDPTITYCPRDGCNAPVAKELDEAYDRLRECSACGYSFCVYCRRTYHGTKSRCVFNQASTIIDKYVNGTEKEQADLEVRYGKTNVKKLVEMYLEEQANARWIESNTTRCPDCSLDVERSFGCAHMTCGRCSCHFCFRCGARLNAKDPYLHYSTPGQSCFNRLFDHVASEEQENMALFDAVMQEHD